MSFSETRDISRMMRTCQTLYLVGVPYILDGSIQILSVKKFFSFSPRGGTDDARNLTAELFEHAQWLESLRIGDCLPLQVDQRITAALSALAALRKLCLVCITPKELALLAKLQCPLRTIELCFHGVYSTNPLDPGPLLARFKDSLQELHLVVTEFMTWDIQYPHVSTLVVDDCLYGEIESLYRSFPNLRNLTFWELYEENLDEEEIERRREMNLQLQNQGRWESLDYVQSSILSLYTLGLRTKVDNLNLYSVPLKASDGDRLSAILTDLRSSSLQLKLRVPEFDMSKLGGFLAPIEETLTSIHLAVNLHGQVYVNPSPMFTAMFASLSTFKIQLLHIHIYWQCERYSPWSWTDGQNGQPIRRKRSPRHFPLDHMDLGVLGQSAMHSISSLRCVCLEAGLRTETWEVVKGSDGPQKGLCTKQLAKLSSHEGWRVVYGSALHRHNQKE